MRTAYWLALCSAILFSVISTGLGIFYLYARPMLVQPEKHRLIEKGLRDPNTPADVVRKTAIEGHDVVTKAYAVVDSALALLLTFGFGAAVIFSYLAHIMRKNARATQDVP